ncbi:hypothetical protein O181_133251 [Austropuccinia psidii MF-1]|uniref:Uncharacterized protein n=1 Tax=Austropuccinia psidii MF-1 TaxID=1389203 RepID=A0A9Q3L7A2_9BASI|nr:hypothetical protein [Austropuccinia psidii MF-1]
MEDARTSTSSQRLASPEADITSISVRPEPFPTGSCGNLSISMEKLVLGVKTTRVGTSPKSLDRHHELLSSSEEVMGPEKTEDLLMGWTPMSVKGQVQQIKAWLKNQSMLSEDQKKKLAQGKENSPVEAPKHPPAKIRLNKCQTSPSKPQIPTRRASNRQRERQSPSGTSLTLRITESQRRKRQPWTMCSIWQEP